MNAEICVRCGLPNQSYLTAINTTGYVPSTTDRTKCVRCGLPNEKFIKFLRDRIKEAPTSGNN